jgi:hypothetical protein
VKVLPQYFEQVNALLRKEAEEQIGQVHPDYYLFQFTVTELKEVIDKPEEWNYFDRLLAAKLLKERLAIDEELPVKEEVTVPTPSRVGWPALIAGYVCGIVFPLYSIPMGAVVLSARRTLSNGLKVSIYDNWSQKHAGYIVGLGIVGMARYIFVLVNR